MLLSVLGAAAGLAILFYGSPSSEKSRALVGMPEFITWVFINDVLFALYPILLALLWLRFRPRKEAFQKA